MKKEKFTFFWAGPFSQWYSCNFTINNMKYNCAEQYMMLEKANLFKDEKSYEKILKSPDPRLQKEIGRNIKNFNKDEWEKVAKEIVFKGNYAKFTQNMKLGMKLRETVGTTLVEASPYDKIWGIGLNSFDPLAQSRETWRGTNWLGETLTKLRETLITEGKI